jgi:hypothetical protein
LQSPFLIQNFRIGIAAGTDMPACRYTSLFHYISPLSEFRPAPLTQGSDQCGRALRRYNVETK